MIVTPWTRKGYSYYAKVKFTKGAYTHTVTRKLGFVSYHLIKLIHGEDALAQIAMAPVKTKYRNLDEGNNE